MEDIRSETYSQQGVTALTACRDVPAYPERQEKWW